MPASIIRERHSLKNYYRNIRKSVSINTGEFENVKIFLRRDIIIVYNFRSHTQFALANVRSFFRGNKIIPNLDPKT